MMSEITVFTWLISIGLSSAVDSNKIFVVFSPKRTWLDARDHCSKMWNGRGQLVEILSAEKNHKVSKMVSYFPVHIGANDMTNEGSFLWNSNTQTWYKNWQPWEPNNYGGNEDCVEMRDDAKWNDIKCYQKNGYVCEMKDTYQVVSTPKNWTEAADYCSQLWNNTGKLVEINDLDKNIRVATWINTDSYIGANDRAVEGEFRWDSSNKLVIYKNWAATEPNNMGDGEGEDCAMIARFGGQWNDYTCSALKPFVCEKDEVATPPLPPSELAKLNNSFKFTCSTWLMMLALFVQLFHV